MIVLDSHCDTPSQIMRLRDLAKDNRYAHIDFPKMKRGKIDASFFALFSPHTMSQDKAYQYCKQMIAAVSASVEANSDYASMAASTKDIYRLKNEDRIAILLGMENGSALMSSMSVLDEFYELGLRYITLCHNADNDIADSAAEARHWNGLSPFGKELIKRMNAMGIIIDVAHASDKSFYDCLKYSNSPIVSTHSCCRALASSRRNMSDDMIKALASEGGVIQINFYPVFLSDSFAKLLSDSKLDDKADMIEANFIKEPSNIKYIEQWHRVLDDLNALERPSYKRVVEHIDHVVQLVGIEHVGIGSDYDGINVCPKGLEDISKFPIIFEGLKERGYREQDIEKIAGANFLRVFEQVESLALL